MERFRLSKSHFETVATAAHPPTAVTTLGTCIDFSTSNTGVYAKRKIGLSTALHDTKFILRNNKKSLSLATRLARQAYGYSKNTITIGNFIAYRPNYTTQSLNVAEQTNKQNKMLTTRVPIKPSFFVLLLFLFLFFCVFFQCFERFERFIVI